MHCLITGGAGTLGIAFAKYLAKDHEVTIVDSNEWAVAQFNVPGVKKILGQYTDVDWKDYHIVIHCAAYKHVDLCENNKESCWDNNFEYYGTMLKEAIQDEDPLTRVLFISTDKAVEPISIYGKSKQEGEKITKEYDGGIIARLGNIRCSNGSVIPIWEKAISEGKPLPITSPQMSRYMIDVDEAVEKIWHLYQKAKPGQVIIPEMGKPHLLSDIAHKLTEGKFELKKNGDIGQYPWEIIGIRPGEKMHEKLKWDTEQTVYKDKYGEIVE